MSLVRPRRPDRPPEPGIRPGEITAAANRAARQLVAARSEATVPAVSTTGAAPVATIAERIAARARIDWPAFVQERIAAWACGYFDDGPAGRRSPWWGQAPYRAWRGEAELDRTPELLGLPGFCAIARTLPRDADALLLRVAQELRLSGAVFEVYCLRLLETVPEGILDACRLADRARRTAGPVKDLLAIRAAWDVALFDAFGHRQPRVDGDLRRALAISREQATADAPPLRRRA